MFVLVLNRKELLADKDKMERQASEARGWIQKGMKDDAVKNEAK